MEKIEFKKIHNVIIDYLKEDNKNNLEIIGSWYFRFLKSDKEKLSLHFPYYSIKLTRLAFNYIRAFTVIFNLLKKDKITEYKGTCLFDIFNISSSEKTDELTLDFLKQKENFALWGEDTLTKLDVFLPVFNKEELIQYYKPKTIKNTFELFKSIRNSEIIDIPQLIELKEKMLSFNNLDNYKNEFISEKQFFVESSLDDDTAIELENQLLEQKLNNSLLIKYPYSKNPHPYLINIANKKFKLVFNNRFSYNDILESDIFLLKDETNITTKLRYSIVDTNHSKDLYDLFKLLKEQWALLELNRFSTPFPKYWLLFLNGSLTKEVWLEQFKKDFPAVAEKPIIKTIERIIEEVIKLDWIEKVIKNSTKIQFPELKSLRKKRLEFVYNNFKNYVSAQNPKVKFINEVNSNNYKNVKVLDSFNIIDLANLNQLKGQFIIDVLVPDYLYFGYQPWIKFHLFNYQFTPLITGLREDMDDNYFSYKEKIEGIRTDLILEIKSDLKIYRNKYKEDIENENLEDENADIEDLEFTNEEEIETFDNDNDNEGKDELVIINDYLTIPSNEKVLLQRDSLLYVKARALKIGDRIIRDSDITGLFQSNDFYDKLVNIPQDVLSYQKQLFTKKNIYKILKNKGISYKNPNYFDKTYAIELVNEQTFRIPRRKNDWAIICEFLNINNSQQQLSFIAYYGRSKQKELKQMYKTIIELFIINNWLGTMENPLILESVSKIVKQHNTIFNISDSREITEVEVSESIISTIFSQLEFTEIKTIGNE